MNKIPDWIRAKVIWSESYEATRAALRELGLKSVCTEAACPNRGECWEKLHATFIILGGICTRGCAFCNVQKGTPSQPDLGEPSRVADAVKRLRTKYAVITSVTRDDLPDKGAGQFVETVRMIKASSNSAVVEILIPDFGGERALLEKIAFSGVEVVGHNIEMPETLYPKVRSSSSYRVSLDVLRTLCGIRAKGAKMLVKSSIMLGLGESEKDILKTISDIKGTGADIMYIGQYLRPSSRHWLVKRYYTPQEFERFGDEALKMGFKAVSSGPLVRSSYMAYQAYMKVMNGA